MAAAGISGRFFALCPEETLIDGNGEKREFFVKTPARVPAISLSGAPIGQYPSGSSTRTISVICFPGLCQRTASALQIRSGLLQS